MDRNLRQLNTHFWARVSPTAPRICASNFPLHFSHA